MSHRVTRANPSAPCPSCGTSVARSRLLAHFRDGTCLVAEVREHMRAAGYGQVHGNLLGLAFSALGLEDTPALRAARGDACPGHLAWAPVAAEYDWEPGQHATREVAWGWWARREVLRALKVLDLLGGGAVSRAVRHAAVRRAYADPEWAEALRAAAALGGRPAARSLARALVPRASRPGRPSPGI